MDQSHASNGSAHSTGAGFRPDAEHYLRQIQMLEKYQNDAMHKIAELASLAERSIRETEVYDIRAEALRNPQSDELVAAAYRTGDRISSIIPELVRNPALGWDIRGAEIRSPADFAALAQVVRNPYIETYKLAVLDEHSKVIHSEILSVGSSEAVLSDEKMIAGALQRIKTLGRLDTPRVIVSHNHPAGNANPSNGDIEMSATTQRICESVGYELIDDIITNGDRYFSFRSAGLLGNAKDQAHETHAAESVPTAMGHDSNPLPLGTPAPWELIKREDLFAMHDWNESYRVLETLRQVDPRAVHIVYVNTEARVVGLERFTYADASEQGLRDLKRGILEGVSREGAHGYFACLPEQLSAQDADRMIRDIVQFTHNSRIALWDIYAPSLISAEHYHLLTIANDRGRETSSLDVSIAALNGKVRSAIGGIANRIKALVSGTHPRDDQEQWPREAQSALDPTNAAPVEPSVVDKLPVIFRRHDELRMEWAHSGSMRRAKLVQESESSVRQLGGSGLTAVPLLVAAKGYVEGKVRPEEFRKRLGEHLSAISRYANHSPHRAIGRGIER